jgi:hypothetical protein
VAIEVDSLGFDDPRLVSTARLIHVRPTPNSFVNVEIPVVVGAEVAGYVLLDQQGLGGVPIVLREFTTGAEFVFVTFSDGAFYGAGVPPGEYEVTVAQAALDRLGLTVPPQHIFVPPGPGEKRFEDLILRLEPLER